MHRTGVGHWPSSQAGLGQHIYRTESVEPACGVHHFLHCEVLCEKNTLGHYALPALLALFFFIFVPATPLSAFHPIFSDLFCGRTQNKSSTRIKG